MQHIVELALEAAGTQFVTVKFLTKEGKERKINGLLRPTSHLKGGSSPSVGAGYTPIWSPRIGWRCFKTANVIEIKTAHATISKGN